MRRRRLAVLAVLTTALVADTALGVVLPARTGMPVLTFAALVGVAIFGGSRLGMVAGFTVGLLLDLLAGPASLAGVHALTAMLTATASGAAWRWRRVVSTRAVALAGGMAVSAAALAETALHRLLGHAADSGGTLLAALVAGVIVTPVSWRILRRICRSATVVGAGRGLGWSG